MNYRDDEDALWHRAHSLQRELDSTQAELVSSREQVEILDAERRRLAARVGESPDAPDKPKVRWGVVAVVAAGVAIPAIMIASHDLDRSPSKTAPPRCEIESAPTGAEVVCMMRLDAGSAYRELNHRDEVVEVVWGQTPYPKSTDFLFDGGMCDQLVLRMTGYQVAPVERSRCGQTIALVPAH